MLFKNNQKNNKGFTLIELLAVIAIIVLFATLMVNSLRNAQSKSRDSKRLAEIHQLQTALDLYYDKYNTFPISASHCGATVPNGGWCNSVESLLNDHWIRSSTDSLSEFLNKDPLDPLPDTLPSWLPGGGGTYFYFANGYGGAGQWYMIIFGLEKIDHEYQNKDGVTACDGHYFHYGNNNNGIITIGRDCQI